MMLFKLIFPLFFLFTAIAAEEYRTTKCNDGTLPFVKPRKQAMAMPRPAPGEPLLITIAAEVMSVSLDEQKEVFQANFTFRQEWNDPRLAFETTDEETPRVIEDPASIWTPDLFFVNKINETSANNTKVENFPDGRVLITESKTVTANCRVSLIMYPFDTQICELKIESYGYTMDDITVLWNTTENVSPDAQRLLCPDHITSVTPYLDITNFRDVKYISPRIAFSLSRTTSVIFLRVLAPMIVIIGCFWGSFTFTWEEMGMRISLYISPILTYMLQINFCIAFFTSPSYLVSLDVWAATSAFAMSFSIFECIYIFYKKRPEEDLFVSVSRKTLIKKRITVMLIVSGLDTLSIISVFLTRLL